MKKSKIFVYNELDRYVCFKRNSNTLTKHSKYSKQYGDNELTVKYKDMTSEEQILGNLKV